MASLVHNILVVHEKIYKATDGWIGHRLVGVPCLLLRTTGARSGERRTNSLMYSRDGERYLVVASNGGSPKAPSWLFNVRADPSVEVQVGRTRFPATAVEIKGSDPEHARLWELMDRANKGRFSEYQAKTTRVIPIVALTRA